MTISQILYKLQDTLRNLSIFFFFFKSDFDDTKGHIWLIFLDIVQSIVPGDVDEWMNTVYYLNHYQPFLIF